MVLSNGTILALVGVMGAVLLFRPVIVMWCPDWIAGPGGLLIDTNHNEYARKDADGGWFDGSCDGGDGGGD